MKSEQQYIIYFKGLKEGVHEFTLQIGKPFFEAFEILEVSDGNVQVTIELIKKTNFLELNIDLSGSIQATCDRCLGSFDLPIEYSGYLVVRFSESEKEPDDEVLYLHPEDHELDLKHYLYECISLSIPIRKVHADSDNGKPGCDPEMLKKLKEIIVND